MAGRTAMAETKAIPFEEKVFEKNKTTNEKVVPKSTGLKGKNSELQVGETHMLHCISRWTGEMPVERHPGAFSGNLPPLLPEEA